MSSIFINTTVRTSDLTCQAYKQAGWDYVLPHSNCKVREADT